MNELLKFISELGNFDQPEGEHPYLNLFDNSYDYWGTTFRYDGTFRTLFKTNLTGKGKTTKYTDTRQKWGNKVTKKESMTMKHKKTEYVYAYAQDREHRRKERNSLKHIAQNVRNGFTKKSCCSFGFCPNVRLAHLWVDFRVIWCVWLDTSKSCLWETLKHQQEIYVQSLLAPGVLLDYHRPMITIHPFIHPLIHI